jgi:hypothetical protein
MSTLKNPKLAGYQHWGDLHILGDTNATSPVLLLK